MEEGQGALLVHYCYLTNTGGLSAVLSSSPNTQPSALRPLPVYTQTLTILAVH